MPNGRSGGFYLQRHDFEQLLNECDGETAVGKTLERPVTASKLWQALDQWKGEEVPVEEQDSAWYIVHFPEWVVVGNDSPLFNGLRRLHTEWLKEWARRHPRP